MDDSWAPKASWNCQPDHDLALSECFSPRLCGSSRRCDPSLSWLRHLRRRSDTIDTSTLAALNYLALRLAWTSYFKSNPTPAQPSACPTYRTLQLFLQRVSTAHCCELKTVRG